MDSTLRDQIAAVQILARVCAVGGLLGCVATISCFLFLPRFHRVPLSRSIFIHALLLTPATVMKLVPGVEGTVGCTVVGSIMQVMDIAANVWLAVIAYLAVAVSFFGYSKRRNVKIAEYQALVAVLILGGVSLLPSLLWTRLPDSPPLFARNVTWCWISTQYPEIRLLSSLIPMLLVAVIIVGAVAPIALYLWSTHAEAEAASELSALGHMAERKMSLFRRPSTFNLPPSPSMAKPRASLYSTNKFARPYARAAVIYLLVMLLAIWIPTFISRLYFTIITAVMPEMRKPTFEEFSLGWSLVQAIFSPLAGFVGFIVLFFLTYLRPGTPRALAAAATTRKESNPSAPPMSPFLTFNAPDSPLARNSSESFAGQRQRRMSTKRSRMLSSAGLEEVWRPDIDQSNSDESSSSADERTLPASKRPSRDNVTSSTLRAENGTPASGRMVIADLSTMTRRASKAHTPTGRLMTWAERRLLLLEQQNAPLPTLRNGTGPEGGHASPKHYLSARRNQSDDSASEMSSMAVGSDLDDDPLSMDVSPSADAISQRVSFQTVHRPSVDSTAGAIVRRGSDVFSP